MKQHKLLAFAMAGAMLAGAFATATPVMADGNATTTINLAVADTTATYNLVIPSTLTIANSGYNAFTGGITVKNLSDATGITSVDVTAASANTWNLLDAASGSKIAYSLVAYEDQNTPKTTFSFTDTTNMVTDAGQSIAGGVVVSDYSNATAGNYSDTITWTVAVQKGTSGTTGVNIQGCTAAKCTCTKQLSVASEADLRDTSAENDSDLSTFTYNGQTYYAYNGFIKNTEGICWHEASAFVAALNSAFPQSDGSSYMLLDSQEMGCSWLATLDESYFQQNVQADTFWTSVEEYGSAYVFNRSTSDDWTTNVESWFSDNYPAFVVIRGPITR